MPKSSGMQKRIVLPVAFEKKPSERIQLQVFLFSRKGNLIEKKEVTKESIEFDLKDINLNDVRIFFAPKGDPRLDNAQSIEAIERFKPYEVRMDTGPKGEYQVLPIPAYLSDLWNLRICRIRGKVTKLFDLGTQKLKKGICNARVHICEVDRIWWIINKIPDDIIGRIPVIIAEPEWPIPVPDPGPLHQESIIVPPLTRFPATPLISNIKLTAGSPEVSPKSAAPINPGDVVQNVSTGQSSVQEENVLKPITQLPDFQVGREIREQLMNADVTDIRRIIVDNFHIFHPIFCNIPWLWPFLYHCDEIKVVYTDVNGLFDTTYVYWWDGDQPDLYFWVECLIDGEWTTVYKPSKPCNTYWNYVCGSEVSINITDPRVRWECNNVINGDIIWIKSIGESASISHIDQFDNTHTIQGKPFNSIGLSDVSLPYSGLPTGDYRRPFGGRLTFKIQFGSGLPSNGMYYYRWSYSKIRNADLSVIASPASYSLHDGQALGKSYTYEYFDANAIKHIKSNTFLLGPNTVNGESDLYIIPPVYPYLAPVNAPELSPLWNQDTYTIQFDSTNLPGNGLYEFYLELFDKNGQNLTTIPRSFFQIHKDSDFSESVLAPDDNLVSLDNNLCSAFKMAVRIDNSKCEANIFQIKVNGVPSSTDCCGFVKYHNTDNLEISFRAYHPNNLATFAFTVQKGTCNDPGQTALTNASGMVIGDAGVYSRNASSIFKHAFTPNQLLGLCTGGKKAAFAEVLRVNTLATNGTYRLEHLDAPLTSAAFALEPL